VTNEAHTAECPISLRTPDFFTLSSHLHFKDTADLCGYPRSRHRARCIVTFCVASSIPFVNDAKESVMATRHSALVWQWRSATLPYQVWSSADHNSGSTTTNPLARTAHAHSFALRGERFQNRCSTGVLTWPVVCLHPNTRYRTPLNRITVHCHTGLSSHVKACRVIKCGHNTIISAVCDNCYDAQQKELPMLRSITNTLI
jgi:hypothetical protein